MNIKLNFDLNKFNTFGVSVLASHFVEISNEVDLIELFKLKEFKEKPKLFLGGGSNILFTKNFNGLVISNQLKGIEILKEDERFVYVKAGSAELWHDLVLFTCERGFWGVENLSFIPGTVGGAPVQNIGAYGVELKDSLEEIEVFDIEEGEKKIFTNLECRFGYRDSIFKNELKDKCFIISVTFKLSKIPKINTEYKVLKNYLDENKISVKSPFDICSAVTAIRKSKLPDPKILGNAGSFFKNIVLDKIKDKQKIEKILSAFPEIPYFEEENLIKIPSGWLIEKSGREEGISWKGYRVGNVGVHDKQALVLVNYGGATGKEVQDLALQIIKDVKDKFDLELKPEVNII